MALFLMLSLLHFLEPNLKARKKSSLNKDSLVYLCFWQKRIALWNFLGLVIARACGDGLKYAAKFLRMGNESLLPLNFVNLKLYLSFALFPSCVFLVTHSNLPSLSLAPAGLKHVQGNFPGEKVRIHFLKWVLRDALWKNARTGGLLMWSWY